MKAAVLCCTVAMLVLAAQGAPNRKRRQANCEIPNCDTCSNPDVECAECPTTEIMSADLRACIKCPNNCEECEEVIVIDGYAAECTLCSPMFTVNPDTKECDQCATNCESCDQSGAGFCDGVCFPGSVFNPDAMFCDACGSNCLGCSTNGASNCDPGQCDGDIFFDSTATQCKTCIPNCISCTSSATECDVGGCSALYYRDATGQCQPCSDNCVSCTLTGCDSCTTRYTVSANKVCEICADGCDACDSAGAGKCNVQGCREGYGYDSSAQICLACPFNCPTCSINADGTTSCTVCYDTFSVTTKPTCDFCPPNCDNCHIVSGKLFCKSNGCQYGYAYNSASGTCHACPSDCLTCSYTQGTTHCTNCVSRFAIRSSDGQCIACPENCGQCTDDGSTTRCTYNYCTATSAYSMTEQTCPACPQNCDSCYIDSAGNVACAVCSVQFTLSTTRYSCIDCPTNCDYCRLDSNGQARCWDQQCTSGYILEAGECTQCPGSGCSACAYVDQSLTCTACAQYYAIDDSSTCRSCRYCQECSVAAGETSAKCLPGKCITGYVDNPSGSCVACPTGCDSCTYDSTTSTTTCKTGGCSSAGRTQIPKDQCVKCPTGCAACTLDSTTLVCDSCASGYTAEGGVCHKCPMNSKRCTFQIVTGNTTTLVNECNTGYTHTGGNGLCVQCGTKCDNCDTEGAGYCDAGQCQTGYVRDVTSRKCKACASNCDNCDTQGQGKCDSCSATFVISNDFTTCSACATDCQSCTEANTCSNGACKARFTEDASGVCRACHDGCLSCSLVGSTIKCDFGQCDVGYVMNKNRLCVPCGDGCAACEIDHASATPDTVICRACIQTGIDKGFATNTLADGVECIACPTDCTTCLYDGVAATCDRDGCDETFGFGTNDKNCQSCAGSCSLCLLENNCDNGYCNTGWMYSSNTDSSTTCLQCDANCDACTTSGECSSNRCATGYGLIYDNSTCSRCKLYDSNCAACSDSTATTSIECTSCDAGYTLDATSTCVSCSSWCDVCDTRGETFCDDSQCQATYALDTDTSMCVTCGTNCASCTAGTDPAAACVTCDTGFRFGTGPGCDACNQNYCDKCDTDIDLCDSDGCQSGFAYDAGACYPCANDCTTCSSAGDCSTGGCDLSFGFVAGVNGANGTCEACDANCKICDGEAGLCNENMCDDNYAWDSATSTCKLVECAGAVAAGATPGTGAGSIISSNACIVKPAGCTVGLSTSTCPEGYCQTGYIWISGTCTACPNNCATCISAAECNLNGCKPGFARKSNGECTRCPTGCVECTEDPTTKQLLCRNEVCDADYQFVTAMTCIACQSNCATCRHTSSGNMIHCDTCNIHTTKTSEQICFTCQENCMECTIDEVNAATACTTNKCMSEYAMNTADSTCHACPARCTECTYSATAGDTICDIDKCQLGYGQHPTTYECNSCPNNCDYCVASTDANSYPCIVGGCQPAYSMMTSGSSFTCEVCPNNCDNCVVSNGITVCLDQQCQVGYGLTSNFDCLACSEGCALCTVTGSTTNCTENMCYGRFAHYFDSADSYRGKCVACPDKCTTCRYDSTTKETVCEPNSCDAQYTMNIVDTRRACVECPTNAVDCTYDGQAYTVLACNAKFTIPTSDKTICSGCASNCLQCNSKGPGKCDARQCVSGYGTKTDDTCGTCHTFCADGCLTAGTCVTNGCVTGYYLDSDQHCQQCVENCIKCNGQGMCTKCASGYTLDNNDKKCYPCAPNCWKCDSAGTTKCDTDSCYPRFALNEAETCGVCPNHCSACMYVPETTKNKCTSCDGTFALNELQCGRCPQHCVTCVESDTAGLQCSKCAERYTEYNFECIRCPGNCQTCTADSATGTAVCDMCMPGFDFDDTNSCTDCATLTFSNCAVCHVETDSAGARTAVCDECQPRYTMKDDQTECLLCSDNGLTRCFKCMDRALSCSQCSGVYLANFDASQCELECYQCTGADCPDFASVSNLNTTVQCPGFCSFNRNETTVADVTSKVFAYGCSSDPKGMCDWTGDRCDNANGVNACSRCCTDSQKCTPPSGAVQTVSSIGLAALTMSAFVTLFA